MSLSVYLLGEPLECICSRCGDEHASDEKQVLYRGTCTHNLVPMATACGLYDVLWCPEENGIQVGHDIIGFLEYGLIKLLIDPETYVAHNHKSGWGTYEIFVKFIKEYLDECKKYPNATIEACR